MLFRRILKSNIKMSASLKYYNDYITQVCHNNKKIKKVAF